ncbi:hypothetical protein C0584_03205 [Candidatus Parcubacteria bacterium]|nr:MAG: hypothetical protein C0584_03205 [Candidatus Parcubacteria bacterium]
MRKIINRSIRKIFKSGNSYALTLPVDLVKELGWRESQKLVVKKKGKDLLISDWKE